MISGIASASDITGNRTGMIENIKYTFKSNINNGYKVATSSTTFNSAKGETSVKATFYYVDTDSDVTYNKTKSNTGSNFALVSFNITNNKYSIYKVVSQHKVVYDDVTVSAPIIIKQ
jgi:hypothetical protein